MSNIDVGQIYLDINGHVNNCQRTFVITAHRGDSGAEKYWTCHTYAVFVDSDIVFTGGDQQFLPFELKEMRLISSIQRINAKLLWFTRLKNKLLFLWESIQHSLQTMWQA